MNLDSLNELRGLLATRDPTAAPAPAAGPSPEQVVAAVDAAVDAQKALGVDDAEPDAPDGVADRADTTAEDELILDLLGIDEVSQRSGVSHDVFDYLCNLDGAMMTLEKGAQLLGQACLSLSLSARDRVRLVDASIDQVLQSRDDQPVPGLSWPEVQGIGSKVLRQLEASEAADAAGAQRLRARTNKLDAKLAQSQQQLADQKSVDRLHRAAGVDTALPGLVARKPGNKPGNQKG